MRLGISIAAMMAMGLAISPAIHAQREAVPKKDAPPLDRLESEIDRLGAGEAKPEVAPTAGDKRLQALGDALLRLEAELKTKSAAIEELEDENEKLRQALRLRFGAGGGGLPRVPIPNRELLESVLQEPAPFTERRETAGSASAPEEYTVVGEWGRSPEVAASLPGKVASLIGLSIAVPPGMPEGDLTRLGKDLRENYTSYDNINIEVFNDVEAARRFANEGKAEAKHRVLSITRFKHSGRDTFQLFRDGRAVDAL